MISKKFDVVVVGELNVDLILNGIDSFPEIGKEKLASQMILTLGSSSAIFASNLSALGAKVAFIGKIGSDSFGDLVTKSLEEKKVSTEYIVRDQDQNTGATIVLNFDEDRAMVTHQGAMEHLTIDDIGLDILQQARHLHFSSYFLQPGFHHNIRKLFKWAKELGLTTSIDPQWDPKELWDLNLKNVLPYVDIFLPNMQELLFLSKKSTLSEAIESVEEYSHKIAVKNGNKGSILFSEKKQSEIEPFLNKNVVDAIGAGDSFNAGFIYKFINGAADDECQRFANLMGAMNTTAPGGTTAFTNHKEIMQIAEQKFGYIEKE